MSWFSTSISSIFSNRFIFYGFIRSCRHMTVFWRGFFGFYWYFYDLVCRAIRVLLKSRRLVSTIRFPLVSFCLEFSFLWLVVFRIGSSKPAFVFIALIIARWFARYGFWTRPRFAISGPVAILPTCKAWTTCRLSWGAAGTASCIRIVSRLSSLVSFPVLHKIE